QHVIGLRVDDRQSREIADRNSLVGRFRVSSAPERAARSFPIRWPSERSPAGLTLDLQCRIPVGAADHRPIEALFRFEFSPGGFVFKARPRVFGPEATLEF